jgi:hypothetical protein
VTAINSVFGLRIGMNDALSPAHAELSSFLAGIRSAGDARATAIARYTRMLDQIAEFRRLEQGARLKLRFQPHLFYRTLDHCRFFSPELLAAVAEFAFHLAALREIDFRKPEAFIRTAQQELQLLSVKKRADAVKIAKLTDLLASRTEMLAELRRRRSDLAREQMHIALYIRDNLAKIAAQCEKCAAMLADKGHTSRAIDDLTADVTNRFRDRLRTAHREGPVTREQVDAAKKDVEILSREITDLAGGVFPSLAGLFKAMASHAGFFAQSINTLVAEANAAARSDFEREKSALGKLEETLIALISRYHLEVAVAEPTTTTAHKSMFLELRMELLDHAFAVADSDRRSTPDRRAGRERRRASGAASGQPAAKRSGGDRRAVKKRRKKSAG